MGIRISTYGFGEDTNIQHVASRMLEVGFPEAPEKTMHLSSVFHHENTALGTKIFTVHPAHSFYVYPYLDQEFIPFSGNKSKLV